MTVKELLSKIDDENLEINLTTEESFHYIPNAPWFNERLSWESMQKLGETPVVSINFVMEWDEDVDHRILVINEGGFENDRDL